jgi:hypothetical protein
LIGKLKAQGSKFKVSSNDIDQRLVFKHTAPLLIAEELFKVKGGASLQRLRRQKQLTCGEWIPSSRGGNLIKHTRPLHEVLCEDRITKRDNMTPSFSPFDIMGVQANVSPCAERVLNGLDIFDEGALITFGSLFTRYHVEDYGMANFQTLQRTKGHSFKVWFIITDPVRGQSIQRGRDHVVSERLVDSADCILLQREGETVYLPPLTYHAVITGYACNLPLKDCYTLLSGRLFADVREGSLWRNCLNTWVQNHQNRLSPSGRQSQQGSSLSWLREISGTIQDRPPPLKASAAEAKGCRSCKGKMGVKR